MDVNATVTTPTTVSSPSPQDVAAGQDIAATRARLQALAATVLDTSGTSSGEDRLAAYEAVFKMSVTGGLKDIADSDTRALYDQVALHSDIAQRAEAVRRQVADKVMSDLNRGVPRTQLEKDAFASLSGGDQTLYFRTSVNAPDKTGAQRFGSIDSYRQYLSATAQLGELLRNGQADGAEGNYASALKLSAASPKAGAEESWTSQALKLFGGGAPKDKVDLSDSAKKAIGDLNDLDRAVPSPYGAGSVASKVV